jgi:hypothetical protein
LTKYILKILPKEIVFHIDLEEKEQIKDYLKNFTNIFFSLYDTLSSNKDFLKTILNVQSLNSY